GREARTERERLALAGFGALGIEARLVERMAQAVEQARPVERGARALGGGEVALVERHQLLPLPVQEVVLLERRERGAVGGIARETLAQPLEPGHDAPLAGAQESRTSGLLIDRAGFGLDRLTGRGPFGSRWGAITPGRGAWRGADRAAARFAREGRSD